MLPLPPGSGQQLLVRLSSGLLREELRGQRHDVRRRAVLQRGHLPTRRRWRLHLRLPAGLCRLQLREEAGQVQQQPLRQWYDP